MALPEREIFVMVGDGSYMMLNSELQTSVMLGQKLIVTVLDNRGYGCINRLQAACGGVNFNNLIRDVDHRVDDSWIDFAGHARSLGALAEKVTGIGDLAAGAGTREGGGPDLRRGDRHRSDADNRGGWSVVGRGGARDLAAAAGERGARKEYVKARAAQAMG